mmetsp:Transcript_1/g.3  ORF Transcript_1/g.3 Transcript_1/m.3 type:complete len:248 (+) Transcript_1:96-839(+)
MADTETAYQWAGEGSTTLSKDLPKEIRMGFVRKVYALLSIQLLATVVIAAPIAMHSIAWVQGHAWVPVMAVGLYIAVTCGMMCAPGVMRTFPANYIVLSIITLALSIMVGFISATYTWQSVLLAAALTTAVVLSLTLYAWTTDTDFTGFGIYLVMACFTFFIFGVGIMILGMFGVHFKFLTIAYDALGVLLFCGYLIYDTQLLIGENGGHKVEFSIDDYCMAAVQLYLDIINLFLLILEMVGERRGN